MIYAVIIAGGEGKRLGGVIKADLTIGGVRLIERVAARLSKAERPLLVATGPAGRNFNLPAGCEAVSDLPDGVGGPLAGLVAAVKWLRDRGIAQGALVSVAVDTPFLPEDYVERLVGALAAAPSAFAAWGEDFYPPNAAWDLARLPELESARSLRALQAAMGAQRVGWDDMRENPFANVNTPENLAALEERASRQTHL